MTIVGNHHRVFNSVWLVKGGCGAFEGEGAGAGGRFLRDIIHSQQATSCKKQPLLANAPKHLVSGLFVALNGVVQNGKSADKRIERHRKVQILAKTLPEIFPSVVLCEPINAWPRMGMPPNFHC